MTKKIANFSKNTRSFGWREKFQGHPFIIFLANKKLFISTGNRVTKKIAVKSSSYNNNTR